MRGKLLLSAGMALSAAVVALGPRGDAPPLMVELAGTRVLVRVVIHGSVASVPRCRRAFTVYPTSVRMRPPPVERFDPRRFRVARPDQPMVRDLLLRYP